MPYELVQSRGKKEGYYVVTKKTREKHSKRPLSLQKAKAQMRALYAAESKSMRGGNVFRRMFGLPLGEYTQQLKDDIDRMIGRDKTERFLLGIRPYTNQEARGIASYYTRGAAQLSDVGTTHLLHGIETGNPLAHSIIREYERRQRKLEIIAQTKSLLADYLKMIRPLESRGIPMGATDAIMISVEIKDGDTMVDFENEYRLGRYYLQSTYDSLPTPKVNPFNRRPIVNPKTYKAKVSPESVYIENPLQRGSRPTVGSGKRGGATAYQMIFGKRLGEYTQQLKNRTDAIINSDMIERQMLGLPNYSNQQTRAIAKYYTRAAKELDSIGTTHVRNRWDTLDRDLNWAVATEHDRIERKLELIEQSGLLLSSFLRTLRPLESRRIPVGSTDAIMPDEITDGNMMVDFQNEYSLGRYYLQSTYDSLPTPKVNPFNRRPIIDYTVYKAKVGPESIYGENPLRRGSRPTVATYIPRIGSGKRGGLVPTDNPAMLEDMFETLKAEFVALGDGMDGLDTMTMEELQSYAEFVGELVQKYRIDTFEQLPDRYTDGEKETLLAEMESYATEPELVTMDRRQDMVVVVEALMNANIEITTMLEQERVNEMVEQEQMEENLEQEQMIGRGRMYGGRINNEPPGGLPPPEEEEEVNDDFQNMINGFINQVNELGNGLETINDMNLAQLRAYAQRVGVILAENHESTKAQIPDQFDDDEKEAILAQNEAYAANPEQMTMARKPNLTLIVMALIDAIVLKIDALQAPVGQMIGQGMCGGSVYDKTFGYLPDYFFEY